MIILDKPYVSELLADTLEKKQYPVLKTDVLQDLKLSNNFNLWEENFAIEHIRKMPDILIYSNSENSINWISKNLSFLSLPEKINLFKDKIKFREMLAEIYPDFYFRGIEFEEMEELDLSSIKFPCIIKPSVGFLSLGVSLVKDSRDWGDALSSIKSDIKKMQDMFPIEVVNSSKFIIEEVIQGEEFAVDAYYDKEGMPVILNIFKHPFPSENDVNDRVYFTSKEIIEEHLSKFEELLLRLGKIFKLKNFPIHIEMRVDGDKIVPIEGNPLRFAGWCTTDLAYFAYGINVYEYYFEQKRPDWAKILEGKDGYLYYFAIAEIPSGMNKDRVGFVDYDAFLKNFEEPLEIRKIDYSKHPIFAIVFAKTKDYAEISKILVDDMKNYTK